MTSKHPAGTRKVFISHIDKMKPLEFIALIQKIQDDYDGVISSATSCITEKIDGSSLRIGLNSNGKFFIQSSTSTEMYKRGSFFERDVSKGYTGEVGAKFDDLNDHMRYDVPLQSVLHKHNKSTIKIIGEILYMPMGKITGDKVTFIRIPYDRHDLANDWVFVPFDVVTFEGERYENAEEILQDLYDISNVDRAYCAPTIALKGDINLTEINMMIKYNFIHNYPDYETVLVSRKKVDKPMRALLTSMVHALQEVTSAKILAQVDRGLFGKDTEGVVIELDNGQIVKVVTDTFKNTTFQAL